MRYATMRKFIASILLVLGCQLSVIANAANPLPPPVQGFVNLAFAGKIARKGQAFNKSGDKQKDLPQRRILGYEVGKDYAYLWYEHGGPLYHQHLVKFSITMPYEVKASYVFDSTTYTDIQQLIRDTRFLNSHLSNRCGL